MNEAVRVRREPVTIPTYEPGAPDRNPMFLEKRVYQGSSGRVYPLPVVDRIAEAPVDREWDAIFLDNGLVEVMLLPEIGGRIHAGRDLSNGYDFFYRQSAIKPALVGLAGPWISGGVEFNWPQHHRPSTFMPTDVAIERGDDGSVTVWMGEHEPMDRTKGMHGVCLHPGRSVVEVKVRLYNRTPYVLTFLWWANVGVHVHEAYKSFFPPDARVVADHAKRALSAYPLAEGRYYGVDYGERGRGGVPVEERPAHFVPANQGGAEPSYPANDLRWYANIPVPTSYMCMGTDKGFFGGYDHFAEAGLIHVADRAVSPGKKQWTWGNHEFGYAWDRNLTDADGPYIELMAGVYTDNQPDFSWIAPGETKSFSQFFYPYQAIGPAKFANLDAALALGEGRVGVAVTRTVPGARVVVRSAFGETGFVRDLAPGAAFVERVEGATGLALYDGEGRRLAEYRIGDAQPASVPPAATEPSRPTEIASNDDLYLTGLHLEQYRHATRDPAAYWREALRRDPSDVRCNNALGRWHLRRGEFALAEARFRTAIKRATRLNPNPEDGEPYYNLGLALRFLGRDDEAEGAFGKAVWNAAWQAAGYHALGELACKRGDFDRALDHLDRSIRKDADNFRAQSLRACVLRRLGREASLSEILRLDPLDWMARHLSGERIAADNGVRLDLAIDFMRAGLDDEASRLLADADHEACDGTAPMVAYYEAYLLHRSGKDASQAYRRASKANPDYGFPSRLEDIAVLESAPEGDARASYYLGNLLYDRRRHEEAIARWESSARLDPTNPTVHRNLGIAYFNVRGDASRARHAYDAALEASPDDSRLWYERDQLWKRVGEPSRVRFSALAARMDVVLGRDALAIEFIHLLNDLGRPEEAAEILANRRFQPWEGGEGQALAAYSRTQLALARQADTPEARLRRCEGALCPPESLGEARHLLANASDVWLTLGDAHAGAGDDQEARRWWRRAAEFRGDFQGMSAVPLSETTYFQSVALERLGRHAEARATLVALADYAADLAGASAKIDYFATSLPTMLLFEDDLQARQENTARFMLAQATYGMGEQEESEALLEEVLAVDPNHARATDLLAEIRRQERE